MVLMLPSPNKTANNSFTNILYTAFGSQSGSFRAISVYSSLSDWHNVGKYFCKACNCNIANNVLVDMGIHQAC